MDDPHCRPYCFTRSMCSRYCVDDYEVHIQKKLEAPMPWIGMYIAAASALCSLAMTVDAFNGFRTKKFWFPCKYFSLNAASLTLLGVAMKLTMDLTSSMMGLNDKIATVSSLVLMSTAMSVFVTSLACMDNNECLLNLTALGILVFTIAGNVCIHNEQMGEFFDGQVVLAEEMTATIFMLLLFAILCSWSVAVPNARRYIESKYLHMHKIALDEGGESTTGKFSIEELRVTVKKYWVMAETGSPQFVMARSAISGTCGVMCLLLALGLGEAHVRLSLPGNGFDRIGSNYKWSIDWILIIQSTGVVLGSVAPLWRWFIAARFNISKTGQKSWSEKLEIEMYWTSRLVDWREKPLSVQIRHHKCRKLLHDVKRLALNICIRFQILALNDTRDLESGAEVELELSRYVLLLEGEVELPKKILTNICKEVDKLFQNGRRNRPKSLIDLLNMSGNFSGVREFDNNQVPSLHSQEPRNCWSLPVVTLTSIAISLPNIEAHKVKRLLLGVSEGLSFVKLIEKTLDTNRELVSIRNAADVVWVGVELYKKWQDMDLQDTSLRGRQTNNETLQNLSNIAERTVRDFVKDTRDFVMQDPLNWPVKVVAANSMYRITQTILLSHKGDNQLTDGYLFEQLSVMISDILAACLTNLVRVITLKCHSKAIKDREESIRQAAVLLGESEEILEIFQQREIPNLDPGKAASIEEWRAYIEASTSASGNNSARRQSNGEHVSDDESEG
ncbi:UNVERIFIED_CONTAM: hypothetical protein Slati_3541900 [Sesamum latifolium]|uniref:Uncharacterized protein n=1 Tax=Sesamum latifolium TaxID=2727402 RepID=A0AAW2UI94_9LAMI